MRWGQLSCSQNFGIRPLIHNVLLSQRYLPPWEHARLKPRFFKLSKSRFIQWTSSQLKHNFHICVHASIVAFEECRRGGGGGRARGRVKLLLIALSGKEEVQRTDHSNCAWTSTATQPFQRSDGEIKRRAGNFYPIFFVSLQSTVQKVSRHFLVFVQPLNDKWLKPPMESRIYAFIIN